MDATTVDDALVTFRVWYTRSWATSNHEEEDVLGLYATRFCWPWPLRGPMRAVCLHAAYEPNMGAAHPFLSPPLATCMCGIYSYSSWAAAVQQYHELARQEKKPLAIGATLIWGKAQAGRLQDYSSGLRYRSEYAQVLALAKEDEDAMEIHRTYGVPVLPSDDLSLIQVVPNAWRREAS